MRTEAMGWDRGLQDLSLSVAVQYYIGTKEWPWLQSLEMSSCGDVVLWRRHSHFSRVSSSGHQLPRDHPGERPGPCTEPGGPSGGLWWPHGWERWQRGGCFRGAGRGSGPTGEQQDRLCQCHVLPPQWRTGQSHWIWKDRQIFFMPTLA